MCVHCWLAACLSVILLQMFPVWTCAACQRILCTRPSVSVLLPHRLECCSARSLTLCVLAQCQALWDRVKGQERWGKGWALQALAAVQRLELSLGAFADSLYSLTQVIHRRYSC